MSIDKFKWSELTVDATLGENTEIAEVPGGWVIKVTRWNQGNSVVALVYIPSPKK